MQEESAFFRIGNDGLIYQMTAPTDLALGYKLLAYTYRAYSHTYFESRIRNSRTLRVHTHHFTLRCPRLIIPLSTACTKQTQTAWWPATQSTVYPFTLGAQPAPLSLPASHSPGHMGRPRNRLFTAAMSSDATLGRLSIKCQVSLVIPYLKLLS